MPLRSVVVVLAASAAGVRGVDQMGGVLMLGKGWVASTSGRYNTWRVWARKATL